jgi:hypothetical protein
MLLHKNLFPSVGRRRAILFLVFLFWLVIIAAGLARLEFVLSAAAN